MDKLDQKPIDLNYMEKSYDPNIYDFYYKLMIYVNDGDLNDS